MAGNAAQDLGELGGAVGTLGVGIGQLAEYAVDGNIALENLAKVAAPTALLAGLSVGLQLFSKWREAQAELAENTRQVTEAFQDGIGSAEDWGAAVDDAFELGPAASDAF